MKTRKWIALLCLACLLASACAAAIADSYDIYYVQSTKPNGYCYLYDRPSSTYGTNLGRHNNGETIYVIDWYADDNYAYVQCDNGEYGYIRKGCLSQSGWQSDYDSSSSDNYSNNNYSNNNYSNSYTYDVYYVQSTQPNGYCYLYDRPSSTNGTNLGRHNNGETVYVLNWYADDNYAYVQCDNGEYGYIRKGCLTQNTDSDYETCYVNSTKPDGYCYLYDRPSSTYGTNMGRHDNGEMIYVIDWNADDNYAKVKCQNGKIGYIRKGCLSW